MGIVTLPSFGSDPTTVTGPLLDGKVDPLATEFNGGIENVNIKAGAGISYSKLNLTGNILNADISTSAAIADSKLAAITTVSKVSVSAIYGGPAFWVDKGATNQTGITTAVAIKATWSTENIDTNNNFASSTFTPTVAGTYYIGGSIAITVAVDQTVLNCQLYKNGVLILTLGKSHASGTGGQYATGGALVTANGTTDYFDLYILHNAGSDRTIDGTASSTYFYGYYVRT